MTAEERLAQLLDEKEAELTKLREELFSVRSYIKGKSFGWMEHRQLPDDYYPELPVPRLQFSYVVKGWELVCTYELVYRHLLGYQLAIPLGQTTTTGREKNWPFVARGPGNPDEIFLPYRDAAHINSDRKALGLPAYAVHGDYTENITEKLRKMYDDR